MTPNHETRFPAQDKLAYNVDLNIHYHATSGARIITVLNAASTLFTLAMYATGIACLAIALIATNFWWMPFVGMGVSLLFLGIRHLIDTKAEALTKDGKSFRYLKGFLHSEVLNHPLHEGILPSIDYTLKSDVLFQKKIHAAHPKLAMRIVQNLGRLNVDSLPVKVLAASQLAQQSDPYNYTAFRKESKKIRASKAETYEATHQEQSQKALGNTYSFLKAAYESEGPSKPLKTKPADPISHFLSHKSAVATKNKSLDALRQEYQTLFATHPHEMSKGLLERDAKIQAEIDLFNNSFEDFKKEVSFGRLLAKIHALPPHLKAHFFKESSDAGATPELKDDDKLWGLFFPIHLQEKGYPIPVNVLTPDAFHLWWMKRCESLLKALSDPQSGTGLQEGYKQHIRRHPSKKLAQMEEELPRLTQDQTLKLEEIRNKLEGRVTPFKQIHQELDSLLPKISRLQRAKEAVSAFMKNGWNKLRQVPSQPVPALIFPEDRYLKQRYIQERQSYSRLRALDRKIVWVNRVYYAAIPLMGLVPMLIVTAVYFSTLWFQIAVIISVFAPIILRQLVGLYREPLLEEKKVLKMEGKLLHQPEDLLISGTAPTQLKRLEGIDIRENMEGDLQYHRERGRLKTLAAQVKTLAAQVKALQAINPEEGSKGWKELAASESKILEIAERAQHYASSNRSADPAKLHQIVALDLAGKKPTIARLSMTEKNLKLEPLEESINQRIGNVQLTLKEDLDQLYSVEKEEKRAEIKQLAGEVKSLQNCLPSTSLELQAKESQLLKLVKERQALKAAKIISFKKAQAYLASKIAEEKKLNNELAKELETQNKSLLNGPTTHLRFIAEDLKAKTLALKAPSDARLTKLQEEFDALTPKENKVSIEGKAE